MLLDDVNCRQPQHKKSMFREDEFGHLRKWTSDERFYFTFN